MRRGQPAPVRACFRYISNHSNFLDYKGAMAAGLPIGSGEIESGHRYVFQSRRTPSLPKTRLYSRRISSLTSQTNVSLSIQFRSRLALGFLGAIAGALSPAIPATRTDVSTTPLGRFRFCPGNDSDLRRLLSSRAVFTNGFQNLFL